MKLTHIMSKFFLTHIVSEAAKTFGKSHNSCSLLHSVASPSAVKTHHVKVEMVSCVGGAFHAASAVPFLCW